MAQKTDADLLTQANVIRDETINSANTADRIGEMFVDSIDSKANNTQVTADIATAVANLEDGVPTDGDTLNKLYVISQGKLTSNDINSLTELNAIVGVTLVSQTDITAQITAAAATRQTVNIPALALTQNETFSATEGVLTVDGINYNLNTDQGANILVTAPASNAFTITLSGAGFDANGRNDGNALGDTITLTEGSKYFYFYRFSGGIHVSIPKL